MSPSSEQGPGYGGYLKGLKDELNMDLAFNERGRSYSKDMGKTRKRLNRKLKQHHEVDISHCTDEKTETQEGDILQLEVAEPDAVSCEYGSRAPVQHHAKLWPLLPEVKMGIWGQH